MHKINFVVVDQITDQNNKSLVPVAAAGDNQHKNFDLGHSWCACQFSELKLDDQLIIFIPDLSNVTCSFKIFHFISLVFTERCCQKN